MMLFKEDTPDPNLVAICKGRETYMFAGQKQLQMVLVRKFQQILLFDLFFGNKPWLNFIDKNSQF
jgi:hypothetical protein